MLPDSLRESASRGPLQHSEYLDSGDRLARILRACSSGPFTFLFSFSILLPLLVHDVGILCSLRSAVVPFAAGHFLCLRSSLFSCLFFGQIGVIPVLAAQHGDYVLWRDEGGQK